MIVKGGFVHVAFALIKRITIEEFLFYVAREECLEQRKRERLG